MIAFLGGAGAALAFAVSTLASARASRLIGAWATVGWVMAVGLPVALIATAASGGGPTFDVLAWLVTAGLGNIVGLGAEYSAVRHGRVGVVAPLVSMEGAIAALLGVLLGAPVSLALGGALGLIAAGGVMTVAAVERGHPRGAKAAPTSSEARAVALALLAAISFGVSLYATERVGLVLPAAWAALAPRVFGVAFVTVPLAAGRRLSLTRAAVPSIIIAGLAEVAGFGSVALGSRADLAVTAILASQFAAIAALGAMIVFRERPNRTQWLGIVAIAIGVALVAAVVP